MDAFNRGVKARFEETLIYGCKISKG